MHRLLLAALIAAPAAARADVRTWTPARFDRIETAGSYDVTVVPGPVARVRAQGSAAALERMEVGVDGTSLHVGAKRGSWNIGWHSLGRVHVTVTAPLPMRAAALAGSGNLTLAEVRTPDFEGSVSGSGNMLLNAVDTREAHLSIAGSGNIVAQGHSPRVRASIAGSGDAKLEALRAADFTGDIAGSGNIAAFADRTATLSIVGSGDARVRGGARCTVSRMGSGRAVCSA